MTTTRVYEGERLRRGRWSENGRPYLVTTVTRRRAQPFRRKHAAIACARVLHRAPEESDIAPLAWVIMPDHVHWLFALGDERLDEVVRRFKSRSAKAVNTALGRSGVFWQRGYHDRAIRYEEDLRDVARYVVANPLRAGLCDRVLDYPFWDAAWL